MAKNKGNIDKTPLSEVEMSLKEKNELQEKKRAELENVACYRIYAHDSSEEDKKIEVNQKMINTIKNLYGF